MVELKKTVVVRRYGLRAPLDWDDDAHEQLFRQNQLWNRLVEIDQEFQRRYYALVNDDDEIRAKDAELTEVCAARDAARDERKRLRQQAQKKVATPMLDQRLKDAVPLVRALRAELKTLRQQRRGEIIDALRALEIERRDQVRLARQNANDGVWESSTEIDSLRLERQRLLEQVKRAETPELADDLRTQAQHLAARIDTLTMDVGAHTRLYWGNANAVVESYTRARSRVIGSGASLRFHRFDASGRFTNQIQGGMSTAKLFAGAHSQVKVKPLPTHEWSRRKRQRTELQFCIYRDGRDVRYLTFPMIAHRPIPDNATIKMVTLNRVRISTHWRWHAVFTCVADLPVPVHTGTHACGVDVGWRKVKDGIRVATVYGTDGERPWHVILPEHVIARFEGFGRAQSWLKIGVDEIHAFLKDAELALPPEPIAERIARIRKAPVIGAQKLAMLAIAWRECPDYRPRVLARLEAWRKRDRKVRDAAAFSRRRALNQRRAIYEAATKRIAEQYAVIGIEQFDLAQSKRREDASGEANPLPSPARVQRDRAAPGLLRLWIKQQAAKTGAEIVEVTGKTTMACRQCGVINAPLDRAALVWRCEGCGANFDQDDNAARNICAAAAGDEEILDNLQKKRGSG